MNNQENHRNIYSNHHLRYAQPQTYQGINNNAYSQHATNMAYQIPQGYTGQVSTTPQPTPISIQQEPDIEYDYCCSFIHISSIDRDIETYPNRSNYRITLPSELKNIYSIELIQAHFPNINNVTNEPYLLLKVDEIDNVLVSHNICVHKSFGILPINEPTTSGYINIDSSRTHDNVIKYYKYQDKANLSKMTISITDFEGNLFNFGTDNQVISRSNGNFNNQNTFVFKITTRIPKQTQLHSRRVFY